MSNSIVNNLIYKAIIEMNEHDEDRYDNFKTFAIDCGCGEDKVDKVWTVAEYISKKFFETKEDYEKWKATKGDLYEEFYS